MGEPIPEAGGRQAGSSLLMNPTQAMRNRLISLRQFMFNGLDTMYYACQVNIRLKNLLLNSQSLFLTTSFRLWFVQEQGPRKLEIVYLTK